MSTLADEDDSPSEGVKFIHEDDGLITACDIETGIASSGETKAEALTMLAEALTLHEGGGDPVKDEAAFLREIGLDPDDIVKTRAENDELPEILR